MIKLKAVPVEELIELLADKQSEVRSLPPPMVATAIKQCNSNQESPNLAAIFKTTKVPQGATMCASRRSVD